MKLLKKTIFVLSIIFITGNASAIIKCIGKPNNCQQSYVDGTLNWQARCSGSSFALNTIKGGFVCSSTPGNTRGEVKAELDTSNDSNDNKYCWCFLTVPAMSKYVYSHETSGGGECMYYCATNCSMNTQSYSTFRNAIFDNLISGE